MAKDQFTVRLTLSARADVSAISYYLIEQGADTAANDFLDGVLDKIATLEKFPMRGVIPEELEALGSDEFRQLLLRPYRIFYRIEGQTVVIMAVADGRRDMRSFLQIRLLES